MFSRRQARYDDEARQLTAKAYGNEPGLSSDRYALGDRLRWRAETRLELRDYPAALRDATHALRLAAGQDRYPLLIPAVRLLVAQLQAILVQAAGARENAGAVEAYRRELGSPDADIHGSDEHRQPGSGSGLPARVRRA